MPKQTPVKTVSELVEEYKALSGGDRQETQWLRTALFSLLEGVVARLEEEKKYRYWVEQVFNPEDETTYGETQMQSYNIGVSDSQNIIREVMK